MDQQCIKWVMVIAVFLILIKCTVFHCQIDSFVKLSNGQDDKRYFDPCTCTEIVPKRAKWKAS